MILDTASGFSSALNLTLILAIPEEVGLTPESTSIPFILCLYPFFLNNPSRDFLSVDTSFSSSTRWTNPRPNI